MPASSPIVPFTATDVPHLTAAFYPTPAEAEGPALPYLALGGPGFERLTFLLLQADGKVPQYFGKSGDTDYGVDLLVRDAERTVVYQCKNWKTFTRKDLIGVLEKFRDEWLSRPGLTRPSEFVVCCPLELHARITSEEWEKIRGDFQNDHGIAVAFWHRDYYDERLRKAPDIVADVFSECAAEDFCRPLTWRYDVFRPVHPTAPPDLFLDSYHELCRKGHLVIDETRAEAFTEILRRCSWRCGS